MFKTLTKKSFAIFTFSLFFIMTLFSFGFVFNFSQAKKASAIDANVNSEVINVNITNSSFASSGSGLPAAVNNFEKVAGYNSNQLKAGIITTLESTTAGEEVGFKKNAKDYNLPVDKNPKTPIIADSEEGNTDYNVLMLNNLNSDGTSKNSPASVGYKTETALTLEANNYYKLTVYALCYENATFSIYLNEITDNKDTVNVSLKHESKSTSTWQPFTFFFKTNNIYDVTANLELWLGSKPVTAENASFGAVFFDNITLKKLSAYQYDTQSSVAAYKETADYTNAKITTSEISDNNFDFEAKTNETEIKSFTLSNKRGSSFIADTVTIGSNVTIDNKSVTVLDNRQKGNVTNTNVAKNKFAAMLYTSGENIDSNQSFGSIVSKQFSVPSQSVFRISFWAYASTDVTANAKLNVVKFTKNGNEVNTLETKPTSSLSITNATDRPISNNYKLYSFVVYGHKNFDTVLNLELGIGSEDNKTFGYALFDDVNVEKLNGTEGTLAESKATKFSLSSYSTEGNSVSNPFFNDVDKIDLTDNTINATVKYPLKNVSSWSYTVDQAYKNDVIYGIIDTNAKHFAEHKDLYKMNDYSSLLLPTQADTINATNNVLLLNNTSDLTWQSYTSSNFSLETASYYKVSAYALRSSLSTGNAFIIVKSGDKTLAKVKIKATDRFELNEIYISTVLRKGDINIELALGTTDSKANGDVLFDNVKIDKIELTEYDAASQNKIDLSKELFNMRNAQNASYPYLYNTQAFTGSANDKTTFGVYDLNDTALPDYLKIGNANGSFNSNIMYIANNQHTMFSTTSNLNFNIEADKYYKFSIFVKTINITAEDDFVETDTLKYGLSIGLNGIDKKFDGIKSTQNYVEYTFYISSNTARTLNYVLTLGTDEAKVKGRVFVNLITAAEITSIDFTNATSHPSTDANKQIIKIGDTTEKTDTPTEGTENKFQFDWYLIPSIIISLILIIVLIGVGVKSIEWRKTKKSLKKTSYDKDEINDRKEKEDAKKAKQAKRKGYKIADFKPIDDEDLKDKTILDANLEKIETEETENSDTEIVSDNKTHETENSDTEIVSDNITEKTTEDLQEEDK